MENPPEEVESEELERTTERKHRVEPQRGTTEDMTEETTGETHPETVPSQSDLLLVVPLRVGGVDVQLPGRGRNTSGHTYSKSGATNKGEEEWQKKNQEFKRY